MNLLFCPQRLLKHLERSRLYSWILRWTCKCRLHLNIFCCSAYVLTLNRYHIPVLIYNIFTLNNAKQVPYTCAIIEYFDSKWEPYI